MSEEQKTLKSCYILDRLREWFELYGNQNHQRAEEELHLAIDELYEYQQKDQKITDLEAKLVESENQCRKCKHLNKKIELNIKNKLMAENWELQKQLAEKNKEIEKINACVDFYKSYYISFKGKVIDELEKVKEFNIQQVFSSKPLDNFIDNQIKQLKGE